MRLWVRSWTLFVRFWAVVGFTTTVIGFSGVPDDLDTWARWINFGVEFVRSDPTALWLAEYAVAIADFLNQGWMRGALVAAGLLMIIWPLPRFWRLRHRAWYWVRRQLTDEETVWVDHDQALFLLKNSAWGQVKTPSHGLFGFSINIDKQLIKYNAYIESTLEKFAESNPHAVKTEDGTLYFSEQKLRRFARMAMDSEIQEDFGPVPTFRV